MRTGKFPSSMESTSIWRKWRAGRIFHALLSAGDFGYHAGCDGDLPPGVGFNYSNPMTSICTTVKRAYPQAKFVGMCHEIVGWAMAAPHAGDEVRGPAFQSRRAQPFQLHARAQGPPDGRDLYLRCSPRQRLFSSMNLAIATCWTSTTAPVVSKRQRGSTKAERRSEQV